LKEDLQEDLKRRFACLSQKPDPMKKDPSIKELRKELATNFDLKYFKFETTPDPIVEKLVSLTCQRNLLIETITTKPSLNDFMTNYSSIPPEDCEDILRNMDKLKVLQIVSQDLGKEDDLNCEKLRDLDSKHRVALLEHCFSINDNPEDAHKKAILISNLIETDDLFSRNDETSKAIKYEIYWAITPEGGRFGRGKNAPYYNLSYTTPRLQTTLAKISPTDPSLSEVRTTLEKALKDLEPTKAAPESQPLIKEEVTATQDR